LRALVLGGTRFIGKRLVETLLAGGHRVTILNRGRKLHPWGSRVTRVVGDRKSARDLKRAAHGGKDVIFDFLSYDAEDARLAVEVFDGKTARFVQISTCSVYWSTGDFPCPVPEEEFDRFTDFEEQAASIEYGYGYAKRKAEEVLRKAHAETGFPYTTIRMPIVGGEADPSTRYYSYFRRIRDGKPLVLPDGGRRKFRHVYVGDVAETLARLPKISESVGREYNLACQEELTLKEVVASSSRHLETEVETRDVPQAFLQERGLPSEFSPFSQSADQVPAIDRAKTELDWSPTPYDEWLGRTARWWSEFYRAGDPDAYVHREKELEVLSEFLNS
jgi:2'-hydroxyisoflavone reductase